MSLENPVFKKFYDDLAVAENSNTNVKLRVRILSDGEEVYVADPRSLRIVRDYISSVHDLTILKCAVPITVYKDKIYPKKLKLEVEIKYVILDHKGEDLKAPEFWIRKYKAILTDPIDPETIQIDKNEESGYEEAMSSMSVFRLQLIDKIAYEMLKVECGGIYPNQTVDNVARLQLSYKLSDTESRSSLINKDLTGIRGVDIVPPDNTGSRLLYVPAHTSIVDVPYFLQKEFGFYSTDIGCYYQMNYTVDGNYQSAQGGWWFIYPLYNFTRFNQAPRTLSIYMWPEKEIADPERTFVYWDKQLSIMATGTSSAVDYSEYGFYSKGNGVVFAKASELLDTLTKVEDHRILTDIEQTKREFMSKPREDSINDIRPVNGYYTDNPFKHASELSKNNIKLVTVQWSNSMPDLLIPGMPTKLLYVKEKRVVEKQATLLSVDIVYKKNKINISDDPFSIHSILTFAVELNE